MNFEIINPSTTEELLAAIKALGESNFRFAAGCTDLLIDLRKNPVSGLKVINLSRIEDQRFVGIDATPSGFWIGSGITASAIVNNVHIREMYPVLYQAAYGLASTQIREVATIGGNICTASPSGDIACALVALDAKCEILNIEGTKRNISIREFFTGPGKTVLKKDDLMFGVSIPTNRVNSNKTYSGFIKIGTRKSMECSIVSLAWHIQIDDAGNILHSGVAIGASAPTIRFTDNACEFLKGKNVNELTKSSSHEFATKVLDYASPISDIRATAWYRREVLFNVSRGILEEIQK